MPVTVLQGDPFELVIPSGNIAGGRNVALNNIGWIALCYGRFLVTSTATVGTRGYVFRFLDAAGNVVLSTSQGVAQTASQAINYNLGDEPADFGGVINNSVWPTPWPLFLPPGSSMSFLDFNGIDNNDTIAGVLVFTT